MVTISEIQRAMDSGNLEIFSNGHPILSIRELHSATRANNDPDIEGVEWRPVVGFEGWYEVSDQGHVRRIRPGKGTFSGRMLKQYTSPHGHKQVRISYRGDGRHLKMVHRLVAEAFIGPRPSEQHNVLHWDDNPENNSVSNLRWGTQGDNLNDAVRNGNHFWASRTECSKGHPLSGDNVKPRPGGSGRLCVECTRKRQHEWYIQNKNKQQKEK